MNSPTDTYFQDLQNLANAQDKAKLATLAAEYAGVLSRLPALRAELENLLAGAQALDYQRLVERYEPALQQASDWLVAVDRLPDVVARDETMQKTLQLTLRTLTLANCAKSIEHFYRLKSEIIEDNARRAREQAEAKRKAEEDARRRAEAEAKRKAEEAAKQRMPIEPDMVAIPAGRFMMGAPASERDSFSNEHPQHEVTFAQGFRLARFPVTFAEYDRYCNAENAGKPSDCGWGRGDRPVINVSWQDARGYIRWLNDQTGKTYRLPTEAEWEYACRAGTSTPFWCGATIHTDQANYDGTYVYGERGKLGEYRQKTLPVATFAPNPWGLYQMHGNVWEWCQDQWHGNYSGAPTDGSAWLTGGDGGRVVRGGSWGFLPAGLRSAWRRGLEPGDRSDDEGFRLAQD